MQLRAMAKINLSLDVVGRREDGYHDVRMIMQTIRMYDLLNIVRTRTPGIHMTTNLPYVPSDERNLVYRAVKLLFDRYEIQGGVHIDLKKLIPVSAGLAGGSSDAAAAMVGINRLFSLHLSKKELMEEALQIGADVPYCILRGTALAEGIGELLTPLPSLPFCYILIGKPWINVSTRTAYQNLNLDEIDSHPRTDDMVEAIRAGDLYGMTKLMDNVFEPGIIRAYPVIGQIKDLMLGQGALNALMSGSGSAVFGIFDDQEKLEKAAQCLKASDLAKMVFKTRIYPAAGRRPPEKGEIKVQKSAGRDGTWQEE